MAAGGRLKRRIMPRSCLGRREPASAGIVTDWLLRSRLTLPLTDLRDKMRPLEVVQSRRGARVDESTCLESMRLGNGTVGSNPTLSAKQSLLDREPLYDSWRAENASSVIGAGPCAIEPCESRQVRKEATVSGQFCVPQDHLAPLSMAFFMTRRR